MRIEKILDRVYRLRMPTPYAVGDVDLYLLVDGNCFDLVDAGPHLFRNLSLMETLLSRLGLSVWGLRRIFLTHGHEDHGGLSSVLSSLSGAEVLVGAADVTLVGLNIRKVFLSRRQEVLGRFVKIGVPPGALKVLATHFESMIAYVAPPARITPLRGGETFEVGSGRRLRVLNTPGHTMGSLCFLLDGEKVLLSGDTLLGRITPNVGTSFYSEFLLGEVVRDPLGDFIKSLEVISNIVIEKALPGHGEVIDDPRSVIEDYLIHHRERFDRIVGIMGGGARSCYEITKELFGSFRNGDDLVLQIIEVLAHLTWLKITDRITGCESKTGLLEYRCR